MTSGRLAHRTPEPRFFFSRDVRMLFCRLCGFSWNRPTPTPELGQGQQGRPGWAQRGRAGAGIGDNPMDMEPRTLSLGKGSVRGLKEIKWN